MAAAAPHIHYYAQGASSCVYFPKKKGVFFMAEVSPSILSADFLNLGREIYKIVQSGADYVHIDVMDGQFVPNISFGMPIVKAIRPITRLPLDVHLMISSPIRYVEQFCLAGADSITIHHESDTLEQNLQALKQINSAGVKAAIAINPATPAEAIIPYLPYCHMVLVMTVEPGFGGQSFRADQMAKLRQVRTLVKRDHPACHIQVDGGIDQKTAALCVEHGADILATGSSFFRASDLGVFVQALHRLC